MKVPLIGNMPSDEILASWGQTLDDYYGIPSTPEEIKLAFIFNLGYRTANNMRFGVAEPYENAIGQYRNHYDKWEEGNTDTDSRESLLDSLCILKFGLKYPKYGDTPEYKERFKEIAGLKQDA